MTPVIFLLSVMAYIIIGGLLGGAMFILGMHNSTTHADRERVKTFSGLTVFMWPMVLGGVALALVFGLVEVVAGKLFGKKIG